MTNTMQRAHDIVDSFNEEQLQKFFMIFDMKEPKRKTETKEERIARKRAAADRIEAGRVHLSDDFDEKQELLNYLDERYTT